ncbi:hypothetical protein A3J61_00625 [Candidatus Nomurabacteria bacterium RIFCSPHIGHO2_02_FULL_38_15]|uniref:NYN domain-containing protein n=1 Tax=Candidatus Nomurabacteria bacterium RIFCSPHIGHO2_02_FULL_38_15 TaxID=1801752 RepID=A0A1F6VSJ9_9BACT|nr:MAG: hypothetical protein A3J61_00625 [Candidatus Nomurabacteria bacterium RIFCSPHIGHO2_02_FULL_38_15]
MKINAYIDSANLHRASNELGFDIDYKKFRGWLRQKYGVEKAYIFIGLIPKNAKRYDYLQRCGFILIFKETISVEKIIKGNCDAELVLNSISDFYKKEFDKCILISGDGDFACLAEFLQKENALLNVLAPNKNKCSFLLRNKYAVELMFLNEHYHKFSNKISSKEKAPDADGSA